MSMVLSWRRIFEPTVVVFDWNLKKLVKKNKSKLGSGPILKRNVADRDQDQQHWFADPDPQHRYRVPSYRVKATGTCEGDTSDEGAEEERGLDHGSGRVRGECGIVVDER
jgi:hypothetical protein